MGRDELLLVQRRTCKISKTERKKKILLVGIYLLLFDKHLQKKCFYTETVSRKSIVFKEVSSTKISLIKT